MLNFTSSRARVSGPIIVVTMSMSMSIFVMASTTASAVETQAKPDKPLTYPQKRAATYDEIRNEQALGRFIVAPDAGFFLYEWSRPYEWAPDTAGLAKAAGARKQTFLYRVTTPDEWGFADPPTSRQVFLPAPGATYYLGSLSPAARRLSFYEIDWDDKTVRAGVVELSEEIPPKIVWLSMRPDDARLDQPPVWVSEEELVYPVKQGSRGLARGNALTGSSELCRDCTSVRTAGTDARPLPVAGPAGTPRVIQSPDGKLSIHATESPEKLTLSIEKNGHKAVLFENDRLPRRVTQAK